MNVSSNAAAVHKPLGKYCHTTLVPASARWLVVSGQVGIDKSGKLATNLRKQAEQCFRNILACLRENGMGKGDLVKTTVYQTDSRFIDDYRVARSRIIGDATLFTSTLVVVDGLASPDLLIEIEAWAAKA
mgnify:FL=1